MANKNILVSSNGKYEPISASVDDVTGVLSSSLSVTINTASYVGQGSLMQVYNGKLIPVSNSSSLASGPYSGSVLAYDNTEGFGPSRTPSAPFTGDLYGNIVTGIKVRSVNNVTGGVLQSLYGGTGTGSFPNNSIIRTGGDSLLPNEVDTIIIGGSEGFVRVNKNLIGFSGMEKPIIYLYTGVVGLPNTTTSYTWRKPGTVGSLSPNSPKPKFIRVICQGGGSSGTNYYVASTTGQGGTGGAGGGYSDVTFNADSIADIVTCAVGNGGIRTGGFSNGVLVTSYYGESGNSGGNTSFGNHLIAYGGTVAVGNDNLTTGGGGYTSNGGNGGGINTTGQSVVVGGAGGGGGGGSRLVGALGGSVTKYSAQPNSGGAGATGTASSAADPVPVNSWDFKKVILNNVLDQTMPKLSCAGGSGGGGSSSSSTGKGGGGSSPTFGSGGGGGGFAPGEGRPGKGGGSGGNGGVGYILIICY